LSNLPIYLGITEKNILDVVNDFMIKNYLSEKNNRTPCLKVSIDKDKRTTLLEMCSVEEMHRFLKVECNFYEKIKLFL